MFLFYQLVGMIVGATSGIEWFHRDRVGAAADMPFTLEKLHFLPKRVRLTLECFHCMAAAWGVKRNESGFWFSPHTDLMFRTPTPATSVSEVDSQPEAALASISNSGYVGRVMTAIRYCRG